MPNGKMAADGRIEGLMDGRQSVTPRGIPGLVPGSDQYEGIYEEMRIPSDIDQDTLWIVHLVDGGSEKVPGQFTFRISSGCMIFHEWGPSLASNGNGDGERRERKARYLFPLERIKFIRKIDG